jgi:hypothetical protein
MVAHAVAVTRHQFNGVKVFAATLARDRESLGERVAAWIAANPRSKIVDIVVTQSSDAEFHCVAITVFYADPT